jgi:hypothetical protein
MTGHRRTRRGTRVSTISGCLIKGRQRWHTWSEATFPHYALADAVTICDAYHCSLFGPTDPNL